MDIYTEPRDLINPNCWFLRMLLSEPKRIIHSFLGYSLVSKIKVGA